MGIASTIRRARLEQGLSDSEVAKRSGLTVFELGDIELRDNEIEMAVPLGSACRLLSVLGLTLGHVLGISETGWPIHTSLESSGQMLTKRRNEKGYSVSELADLVGFDGATIRSLESVPSFGESLPIFLLKDIEDALEIPRGRLIAAISKPGRSE